MAEGGHGTPEVEEQAQLAEVHDARAKLAEAEAAGADSRLLATQSTEVAELAEERGMLYSSDEEREKEEADYFLGRPTVKQARLATEARLAREEREEQWRFKREREQARLVQATERARACRLRAEKAERDADNLEPIMRERVDDMEQACQVRRDKCSSAELGARTRLQEATRIREEAEAECTQRIHEAQVLLQGETDQTLHAEAMLGRQRRSTAARWEQVRQAEEQSRARLAARDGDAEREMAKAQKRERDALQVLQDREREVQKRCEAEIQVAKARLAKVKEMCRERVDLEVVRKSKAEEQAQERLAVAASRLQTDQTCANHVVAGRRTDCSGLVSRAKARDEISIVPTMEASIARHWNEAATKAQSARQKEAQSKQSLETGVYILGGHYSTRRQYRPLVDDKISNVLQGTLHGKSPTSVEQPAPSPRALQPPDVLGLMSARERRATSRTVGGSAQRAPSR